jgi:hypothetical protein
VTASIAGSAAKPWPAAARVIGEGRIGAGVHGDAAGTEASRGQRGSGEHGGRDGHVARAGIADARGMMLNHPGALVLGFEQVFGFGQRHLRMGTAWSRLIGLYGGSVVLAPSAVRLEMVDADAP